MTAIALGMAEIVTIALTVTVFSSDRTSVLVMVVIEVELTSCVLVTTDVREKNNSGDGIGHECNDLCLSRETSRGDEGSCCCVYH